MSDLKLNFYWDEPDNPTDLKPLLEEMLKQYADYQWNRRPRPTKDEEAKIKENMQMIDMIIPELYGSDE